MDALLSPVSQTREDVDRAGKSLTPAESGVHVQGGYSAPIVMSAPSGPEAEETHCVLSRAPRRRSARPAQLCPGPAPAPPSSALAPPSSAWPCPAPCPPLWAGSPSQLCPPPPARWAPGGRGPCGRHCCLLSPCSFCLLQLCQVSHYNFMFFRLTFLPKGTVISERLGIEGFQPIVRETLQRPRGCWVVHTDRWGPRGPPPCPPAQGQAPLRATQSLCSKGAS